METYTTREGMVHCSNCGSFLGDENKNPSADYLFCGTCDQIDNATEDDYYSPNSDE